MDPNVSPPVPEQLQPVESLGQTAPEMAPMPAAPELPANAASTPAPAVSPAQSSLPGAAAPVAPVAPVTSTPTPVPVVASPVIADDVDVIEKEWVDAAQAVIEQTAGDPHAEEEAEENLQIDYLKKRYGKDVKKSYD